jgi:hypothetical protein
MPDRILSLIETLRSQGTTFELVGNRVRWRVPRGLIKTRQKQLLADNAPIIVAILEPDKSLPDVLTIAADVPNTMEGITACINAQRTRRAA